MEGETNWILSCHFHRRPQICFSQEAKSEKMQSFYFEHLKLVQRMHHGMKIVTQVSINHRDSSFCLRPLMCQIFRWNSVCPKQHVSLT